MAMTVTMEFEAKRVRNQLREDAEASSQKADLIDGLLAEINRLEAEVRTLKETASNTPAEETAAEPVEGVEKADLQPLQEALNEVRRGLPWQPGHCFVASVGNKSPERMSVMTTLSQEDADFLARAPYLAQELINELSMARQGKFPRGNGEDLEAVSAQVANSWYTLPQLSVHSANAEPIHMFIEQVLRTFPTLITELTLLRAEFQAKTLEQASRA
jgi:hypothetical protein